LHLNILSNLRLTSLRLLSRWLRRSKLSKTNSHWRRDSQQKLCSSLSISRSPKVDLWNALSTMREVPRQR
jgi:hypothetical protein